MVRSPPISDCDYINFLVAAQCDVSCVKAAECFSGNGLVITHDAFNRFLTRQSLTPETLWAEVEPFIEKRHGWFVLDDTVIDKSPFREDRINLFPVERQSTQGHQRDRPDYPGLDRWDEYVPH